MVDKKEVGVPDFVLLDKLTEECLMENLVTRFKADSIYTYIGDVIVSVNPFKSLPIYDDKFIQSYRGRYKYERPPHAFAVANDAYRAMVQNKMNQCIIISGESGAGKTEASKIIMKFITAIVSKSSGDVDRVKRQLLESNPLLEAFGNAKTLRNDNSSRFGKYMEMQFDNGGVPVGGKITNYLLEKSRVVGRAIGERSFHIFYQMLTGLKADKIAALHLTRNPSDYHYLKISECTTVPTIDDAKEFLAVNRAMEVLGIKPEDQNALWSVLAAILLIGNVRFDEMEEPTNHTPYVKVSNPDVVSKIAANLQVDSIILGRAFTHRTITSGLNRRISTILVPLDSTQALYSRDALAKALYERVFNWLVSKVNSNIKSHGSEKDLLLIGLLDIYGFEIFEKNSFEQLNINYCNEKLQQLFIELTLKSEQEEYVKEGIEWEPVKYFNNKTICELIEKKPVGIISLLDEACLLGKGTDQTFLDRLSQNFGKHAHFETYGLTQDRTLTDGQFRLKHYAGDVTYNVTNFLDKNKDTLFPDLIQSMQCSLQKFLLELFPPITAADAKKRPETAGSQFRTAMNALIVSLQKAAPHYVRCIKSNDSKAAGRIDDARVMHQVRYLGLLENVRVRRAGFANRQEISRFYNRYKCTSKTTWPVYKGAQTEAVVKILEQHGVEKTLYRLGKTKVFIRKPETLFMLEEKREKELPRIAIIIQKVWRGFHARNSFKQRRAAIKIQMIYRVYKFRKWFLQLFKAFANVKTEPNWGKNITYPTPPPVLARACELVKKIHACWRAEQMIKKLGADETAVRQKVTAYDCFHGRKPWTVNRRYEGDYLDQPSNPLKDKYAQALHKIFGRHGDTEVLFCDYGIKMNDKGKLEKRGILVSNKHIFKMHPKTFAVRREAIPLSNIHSVSVSPHKDAFIIFHVTPPSRDLVVDMCLSGHDALSEIVSVVVYQVRCITSNKIPVNVANSISFNNARPSKKDFMMVFTVDTSVQTPTCKKKDKNNQYTVLLPPA